MNLASFKRKVGRGAFLARKKIYHGMNNIEGLMRRGRTKVAIVSSDKWRGKVMDDLLLQRALIRSGFSARIISWQDPLVDYGQYDGLILGSMWGYQNHLGEFEKWMKRVLETGVVVFNDLSIVQENYDKVTQIRLLKSNKLPHIETEVIKKGKSELLECLEKKRLPFVVKPSISGSGEGAFLVKDLKDLEGAILELEKINTTQELLVQPFVSEISEGEVSVVVVAGEVSHAVLRRPGVFREGGKYEVHLMPLDEVDEKLLALCRKIAKLPDYHEALYMRVDAVLIGEGYKIMELELFEPQLFYYLLPKEQRRRVFRRLVKRIRAELGA